MRRGTPLATIVAVTDQEPVFRRLALMWGVAPLLEDLSGDIVPAARRIGATLVSRGIVPSGSPVVLVSMSPDLGPGPANFMKLQTI